MKPHRGPVSSFGIRHSGFSNLRHRGFSFTEIMFAVVILGIGFIMVAAIFPVAISQSQTNTQESVSAAVVRGAVNYLEQMAVGSDNAAPPLFPATFGQVISSPFTRDTGMTTPTVGQYGTSMENQWRQIRGNTILSEDPRFAFVTMYRRAGTVSLTPTMASNADWAGYAQVIVIAVRSSNRPTFTSASVNPGMLPLPASQMPPLAELQPQPAKINIEDEGAGPGVDLIRFWKDPTDKPFDTLVGAVAEGAFVVVSNDGLAAPNAGLMNGHIYRVGARRTDLDDTSSPAQFEAWELAAGFDFSSDAGADGIPGNADDIPRVGGAAPFTAINKYANGFVVGRGFADSNATPSGPTEYEGPSMAVTAYATWIRVR